MRVLVADDDPLYRNLLENLLTNWSFDVALACNGREALDVMRQDNAPQLIILDWMMPEVDGFEVARTIRNEKPDQNAYILLITGSRKKEDVMKVLVCGADDYLMKPFDPIDLKVHLRTATRFIHMQDELNELRQFRKGGEIGVPLRA